MARQRWGSFSVRDHLHTRALATDVLLYDRLIFPVPPKRDEKALDYWRTKGWDPDFLQSRLMQLKGLTRTYRWGRKQHEMFKNRFPRIRAHFDLENMAKRARGELAYEATRMMIAEDRAKIVPDGTDADVVVAYQSRRKFGTDFMLRQRGDREARLGYLLTFMVHVPAIGNEDANLETALGIARDHRFQRKRRALYGWQESVLAKSRGDRVDLEEFQDLVEAYNAEVKAHVKSTRRRFGFMLATMGLGLAEAEGITDLAGEALELIGFATTTGAPIETGPTAMFHHIDQVFGRP